MIGVGVGDCGGESAAARRGQEDAGLVDELEVGGVEACADEF